MEKNFFSPVDLTKKQGQLVRKKSRVADPAGVDPDPDLTLENAQILIRTNNIHPKLLSSYLKVNKIEGLNFYHYFRRTKILALDFESGCFHSLWIRIF